MTHVAACLARASYNVFTYSIRNFSTLRAMEQLRHDVYPEARVKALAVGAGYADGLLGVSHHATEDIAMLRAIHFMAFPRSLGYPCISPARLRSAIQRLYPEPDRFLPLQADTMLRSSPPALSWPIPFWRCGLRDTPSQFFA